MIRSGVQQTAIDHSRTLGNRQKARPERIASLSGNAPALGDLQNAIACFCIHEGMKWT